MTPEANSDFAALCASVVPGFVALGPPRRARKSELLEGEVGGAPVLAKRLLKPNPVWAWYQEREIAMYRALAEKPSGVRMPRLIAASRDVLVIERLDGEPLATKRRPRAALPIRTIAAILTIHEQLASWSGRVPDIQPSALVRAQLRERLLEDPTEPVDWVRGGILRCGRRGLIEDKVAQRIADALGEHAPVSFAHGDLLLRNVIAAEDDDLALVDWECAGRHVRDWDLALLWTQLAPLARGFIEDAVRDSSRRWRAFLGLVVFALCREVRFLQAFNAKETDSELVRTREELAEAIARLT